MKSKNLKMPRIFMKSFSPHGIVSISRFSSLILANSLVSGKERMLRRMRTIH